MGRGTRADGAIVLAYRQGGADGPVRAESRVLGGYMPVLRLIDYQ